MLLSIPKVSLGQSSHIWFWGHIGEASARALLGILRVRAISNITNKVYMCGRQALESLEQEI